MMNNPGQLNISRLSTRQVILATLLVSAIGLGFWLLVRFHTVLILLFLGIVLGTALRPAVVWLSHRGVPRTASIILIYLMVGLAFAGLIIALIPIVVQQTSDILIAIPEYYGRLRVAMTASSSELIRGLSINLPTGFYLLTDTTVQEGGTLDQVASFFTYLNLSASVVFMSLSVFLIAAFWTLERQRSIQTLIRLFPFRSRPQAREFIQTTEARLGAYLRAQALLSLIVGGAALIAYLLIGLPYALVLGIVAGVFEAIPLVGPLLGALPALIVAFSIGTDKVIGVLIASVIIQGLENYLLVPRIMKQITGLNSIVTIIALVTFGTLLGLPGALIAVPVSVVLQLCVEQLFLKRNVIDRKVIRGRDYVNLLRYEAEGIVRDVRKQVRKKDDPSDASNDQIEDLIESIARDLDVLLTQNAPKGKRK